MNDDCQTSDRDHRLNDGGLLQAAAETWVSRLSRRVLPDSLAARCSANAPSHPCCKPDRCAKIAPSGNVRPNLSMQDVIGIRVREEVRQRLSEEERQMVELRGQGLTWEEVAASWAVRPGRGATSWTVRSTGSSWSCNSTTTDRNVAKSEEGASVRFGIRLFRGKAMSDTPDSPSDLSRATGRSESPVARLSALWLHGQAPDLRAFLAGAGHLSAGELTDVLCINQRERWLRGDRPEIEAYLRLHSSIHAGSESGIHRVVLPDHEQAVQCELAGELRRRDRQAAVVPVAVPDQSMEVCGRNIRDVRLVIGNHQVDVRCFRSRWVRQARDEVLEKGSYRTGRV